MNQNHDVRWWALGAIEERQSGGALKARGEVRYGQSTRRGDLP